MRFEDVRQAAVSIAIRAGNHALEHQAKIADLVVEEKNRLDFVTDADRLVEQKIVSEIKTSFPADAFLGEEGAESSGSANRLWIIDPIDGTHNFLRGMSVWAVSIAVVENANPVAAAIHAPSYGLSMSAGAGGGAWTNSTKLKKDSSKRESSLVFTGVSSNIASEVDKWLIGYVRDTLKLAERRVGAATIGLLETILGRGDLYIGFGEHAWDVYAAAIIAEEANLAHTIRWRDGVVRHEFTFVCGRPELVERTLDAIEKSGLCQATF